MTALTGAGAPAIVAVVVTVVGTVIGVVAGVTIAGTVDVPVVTVVCGLPMTGDSLDAPKGRPDNGIVSPPTPFSLGSPVGFTTPTADRRTGTAGGR